MAVNINGDLYSMNNHFVTILAGILGSFPKADPLYLDPGSGSILIQLIIASALGAALIVKTSWSRIKRFFGKKSSEVSEEETSNEDE